MPELHPTDRHLAALIDGRLSGEMAESVRSHVRECARCQFRVGAADEVALSGDRPTIGEVPVTVVAESRVDPPAQGDVWRLTWDAISVLAVIWAVEVERVSVLPILDTVDADEWSALLDRDVTGGLGQLAVSVALETPVPWSVLDARVSRLAETDMLSTLRAAFRSGAPSDTPRGEVVRSPLDERLVNVELVAESLHELANAVWAPLPALATAVDLDFDVLTDAGVAVNRALAIVRGASPTDDEVEVIDAATGRRPGIPPVDDELRRKIDQPRRKAAIRVRARANRGGEAAERLALARLAQPALAAARGTHGAPPDYDTILDRLLNG